MDERVREHAELLVDWSARMEVDSEVVQRDGVFRWEDGFEDGK